MRSVSPAPACDGGGRAGEGGTGHPPAQEGSGGLQTCFRPPTSACRVSPAGPVQSPLLHAQWLTFLERSFCAGHRAKRFLV